MESMFGGLLLSPHIPEQANWQQIQGAAHSIHHWPGDSAKNAAALFDSLLANLVGNGAGARQLAAAGPVRSRSQR
ncbi:MAG TPA: ParA family protein, partial [Arthrobacter sp.]|nr:ParA family protein [Arthrobacter sp.]